MSTHGVRAPRPSDLARRTLIGAAWSTPVVAVAVGAPMAAASTAGPTARVAWDGPTGVQKESSLLLLVLQPSPRDAPVVRGTGTLTLTVLEEYAFSPARSVVAPAGWTVIDDHGRTITMIAPAGVRAGTKGFNVEWGELSGNWTTTATWTESDVTGSVSSAIEVGPRGFPSMQWTTNPAVRGGTSTLRLTVPADCYAIGYQGLVVIPADLFDESMITLPAGWSVLDEGDPANAYVGGPTVAGATDFGFAFGPGSAPISPVVQWIAPTAPGTTPIQARPPLRLAPA
ncbi:hypothetical protein GTU73_11280 [Rathayibacter sp. VKM Ac-2804]|uniref:hypothetical protein n=1 Tax=Rathayibacter sp. VKM Ac-2804 TaxID=2609257 RepID=UPI00132E96D5|nr:hypothetical protein [Rathayibacter sp. VKM Ac-2804]QHF24534.1 hypothetical protein GTU73_11280 [Rathayibacter sp. VKM Ac-2804]